MTNGTRWAGEISISPRNALQASTSNFSCPTQASALFVDFRRLRSGVGLQHDRGLAAGMAVRQRRNLLPQLLGDERNDRVRKAQRRFEHAQQRAPGRALLRVGPGLHLNLRDFDIPVAVLVPHELVDCAGGVVEPVFGKPFCHFRFGFLQQADDPAVGLGKIEIASGTAFLRRCAP